MTVSWLKLPIIGAPGAQCGRHLLADGVTVEQKDFQAEYGPCHTDARWLAGQLFLCQEHAAVVAAEFGDDITEIERVWKAML